MTSDERIVLDFLCRHGPTLPMQNLGDAPVSGNTMMKDIVASLIDQGYIDTGPEKKSVVLHLTAKGEAYCGGLGSMPRFKS